MVEDSSARQEILKFVTSAFAGRLRAYLVSLYSQLKVKDAVDIRSAQISEAFYLLLLALANIAAAIATFVINPDSIAIELSAFANATLCVAGFCISLRWPTVKWPTSAVVVGLLTSFVIAALECQGTLTPGVTAIFPIVLTVFMLRNGAALAVYSALFGIVAALSYLSYLGFIGEPTQLSNHDRALLHISYFMINIMHVAALTIVYRESQIAKNEILEAQRAEIALASSRLHNFLSVASHELRTPMNAILGALNVLDSNPSASLRRDMIDLVTDSIKGLNVRLDDLLDLSRVEQGSFKLKTSSNNLLALTTRTIELWRIRFQDKGLYINFNHDDTSDLNTEIDAVRYQQVLSALAANSLSMTQIGGLTIDLRCSVDPSTNEVFTRVLFSDTGPGFNAKDRQNAFHPEALSKKLYFSDGERLSLSVCKRIANQMQGDITILDRPASGAHLLYTLRTPITPDTANDAVTHPAQSTKFRILCVDDHPANLRILNIILEEQGFAIDVAMNGEQAVKLCNSHRHYDVILMDIMMPGMTGIETTTKIRELKTHNACTPIIALTANVSPESSASYISAGMIGVVPKPIETRVLLTEITHAITKRDYALTFQPFDKSA